MPNGNMVQYTRSNPEQNRLRLVDFPTVSHDFLSLINNLQLSETVSGVIYLHELGIVHGDLKGVSVMFLMHHCFTDKQSREASSSMIQALFAWPVSIS